MWVWFLGGYAVFVAVLIGAAAFVALFGNDEGHRAAGYKVLKLIWGTATGAGGVVALALKLHQAGLL
jgi:hypothetical protein